VGSEGHRASQRRASVDSGQPEQLTPVEGAPGYVMDGRGRVRSVRSGRPPVWDRPGAVQDYQPRAMRPSSAMSGLKNKGSMLNGPIGSTPWQPSIGGGNHTSYTQIGGAQNQPQLGDCNNPQSIVHMPVQVVSAGPPHNRKQAIAQALAMVEHAPGKEGGEGVRRLIVCPNMKVTGMCRLPSCPYIHEVNRKRKEHLPLYNANAPRMCEEVMCRFMEVLGTCPHGENCAYSHGPRQTAAAAAKPKSERNGPQDALDALAVEMNATDKERRGASVDSGSSDDSRAPPKPPRRPPVPRAPLAEKPRCPVSARQHRSPLSGLGFVGAGGGLANMAVPAGVL